MTSDVYFAATFTDIVIQATLASSRRSTTTATARSSSSSTAASTRPVSSLPATTSSSATWRSGLSSYSPRVNSVTSSSPPLPVSWTTRRPAGSTLPERSLVSSTRLLEFVVEWDAIYPDLGKHMFGQVVHHATLNEEMTKVHDWDRYNSDNGACDMSCPCEI